MSATIFYFSGTGNSYAIAKGISDGLSGRLVPMASLASEDEVSVDADTVGIVFPVYYTDVPNVVRSFIPKLKGLASKYVFAVCNFGGGAGSSLKTIKELIHRNGGELSAAWGVHMPQNAFYKPWEKKEKLYAGMHPVIARICRQVGKKAKTSAAARRPLDILLKPFAPMFKSMTRKYLLETVGGSEDQTDMDLIYRLDCVLSVSEKCTGCGLCAKVCPANNIVMENGRPEWTHRCENCLACYNFCPQKAISGIAKEGFYHLNPGYSLRLAQAQTGEARQ